MWNACSGYNGRGIILFLSATMLLMSDENGSFKRKLYRNHVKGEIKERHYTKK